MIVKMKKLYVFFLGDTPEKTEEVSKDLREVGALHIEAAVIESQYRNDLNKTLHILQGLKKQKQTSEDNDAVYYVSKALELTNEKKQISNTLKELDSISNWYKSWGVVSLPTVEALAKGSVFASLYEIKTSDIESDILKDDKVFVMAKDKKSYQLLHIGLNEGEKLEGFKKESVPSIELADLPDNYSKANDRISAIDKELLSLACHVDVIKEAIAKEDKKLELDAVQKRGVQGSGVEGVNCLQAFIPASEILNFEKTAKEKGWGISFREPVPEDEPPTQLKSSKLVKPVEALYDMIGLNIGYYEADISPIFYFFYIIFTAMLIGDAGYASLFLMLTVFGHIKAKKPNFNFLSLGYVLSIATLVWGALIGNWFGVGYIANLSFFKQMIIPELASFNDDGTLNGKTTNVIMNIAFIIGITHLTVARLVAFWQRRKSLDAIGQLAWIGFLFGIFFLLRELIFGFETHPYFIHQMIISMVLIVLFSDTQNGFVKGITSTLLTAPFDFIGGLSDIASYLRLFAVGTAALMLAWVFNGLAADAGIIFGPLIILVGHAFNIVLCLFGVFVHATRLKTVEFSNHAQFEWAGKKYKPFKV